MSQAAKKQTGSAKARLSAARLLAVQAVYQMLSDKNQSVDTVVKEYLDHRLDMEVDGDQMVTADVDHFPAVVRGVTEHQEQLVEMVALNRGKEEMSETLLQAIFLCGAFELMVIQSIEAPIIISDYIHVTHAFYDENEEKLVNAVLDSIRKTVRN